MRNSCFRLLSAILGPKSVDSVTLNEIGAPVLEKAMYDLNNMELFSFLNRANEVSQIYPDQKIDIMNDMGIDKNF